MKKMTGTLLEMKSLSQGEGVKKLNSLRSSIVKVVAVLVVRVLGGEICRSWSIDVSRLSEVRYSRNFLVCLREDGAKRGPFQHQLL